MTSPFVRALSGAPLVPLALALSLVASPGPVSAQPAAERPNAGMLRFPDVSADSIVFLYADDLWTVPRTGGVATPLASPPGEEQRPRFSPDGSTLAFVGNYDGNRDLYTVPVEGGVPLRVTHHPTFEQLSDWTPDGRLLFAAFGMGRYPRAAELWSVDARGGLPAKLPVPYGANAAVSPDGEWLAYTLHAIDHRTWKRYRGGMATDIWLFHLTRHEARKVTDWPGLDTQPMWHGADLVYLSDEAPPHRLNLWRHDPASGRREQLTRFTDHDVKWPAIGPGPDGRGEVVFQHGSNLQLLDLGTGAVRTVDVRIPGARAALRPQTVDAAPLLDNVSPSPTAKRVLAEARGDLWTLPAEKGSPRNLTRTSGVAERDPAWSPDGKWIAYVSDATGEYELYVAAADGSASPRQVTTGADRWISGPAWSPDSKKIAYWDLAGTLRLADVATAASVEVDRDPWAPFPPPPVAWSHDSGWLAYPKGGDTFLTAIWLYDVRKGAATQVTSGRFADAWPTFDRKGDLLYFASTREFTEPLYQDVGFSFVYTRADRLYAVPLRADVDSPLLPVSDEEGAGDDKKDKADKTDSKGVEEEDAEEEGEAKTAKPIPALAIDLAGFEERAILLPPERGAFAHLAVADGGKLLYTRHSPWGGESKAKIEILDLEAKKDDERVKTIVDGVDGFQLSADGKKLLVRQGKSYAFVEPKPDQKLEAKVPTSDLLVEIEPRAEWRQMFHEAWRLQRDFFYDPGMHGVDWAAQREVYGAIVEDCASRSDLSHVVREMISELNVGHAYYFDEGPPGVPSVAVGMPGADFELANGAYRFARIYRGAAWDAEARGPLGEPGLDVREGDYLLAVNGVPVDPSKSPWAAFQGLAGKVATLSVSTEPRPAADSAAIRQVAVRLGADENALRFRAWVEANRRHVEERSGGRIGYIYVPDTGRNGQNELFRQFYGQAAKEALLIDERWNGGGQIPTRFVELLDRPIANYWARRDGRDWPWPFDAHQGPKAMLINGLAGSGGDYFPFWFRARGLGKLIGTRTWGGLVGISGNPNLIDGGVVTVPTFAFYEPDGTWGIEGHGVDPDIEVLDDPAKMAGGADVQLDAAIDHLLAELDRAPYRKPARPPYRDRSGMVDRPEDH